MELSQRNEREQKINNSRRSKCAACIPIYSLRCNVSINLTNREIELCVCVQREYLPNQLGVEQTIFPHVSCSMCRMNLNVRYEGIFAICIQAKIKMKNRNKS